jgi:hypothetical protein
MIGRFVGLLGWMLVEWGGDEIGFVFLRQRFHWTGILAKRPEHVSIIIAVV